MRLLGKSDSYENIILFMTGEKEEHELTEHEQARVHRLNEAWTLLSNFHSTSDAVAILRKRNPKLSRATAYRDCADAISLFGDISRSTKEGIKHLSTEIVKYGLSIARAQKDADTIIKGGLAIARINGVNVNDPDLPDFSKLEPHTYNVVLDDLTQKAILLLIRTGRIDLNMIAQAMQEVAEDVEYTEVKAKALPDAG
jgi:hypothetical protein